MSYSFPKIPHRGVSLTSPNIFQFQHETSKVIYKIGASISSPT